MQITGTCRVVDVSKLFVSELNTRIQKEESPTSEAFVWLCNSIKSEGLVEPIVVRPVGDRYEIVAGTRRFAALKHIGANQASVVVKEMNDQDVRIASLIENIHRLDLDEDEKEYTMRQIYLTSFKEWANPKDLLARPFATDEDKLALAKSYLNRIWNEHTGSANHSLISRNKRADNLGDASRQKTHPTDAFKYLSGRVGYAISTQINILRGAGSLSSEIDFYDELPPTYKEIADRIAAEKKLAEHEKQTMAKRMLTARKKQKKEIKHPKTQRQKAERAAKTFANKVERHRAETERKRTEKQISKQEADLQKSREAKAKAEAERRLAQQTEIVQSAVRAREQLVQLGVDLFETLTGQQLETNDFKLGEIQAKSVQATQTMQQLASFMSTNNDIAAQQAIVIPLNIALTKYRDMLYDAAESQKGKQAMGGR